MKNRGINRGMSHIRGMAIWSLVLGLGFSSFESANAADGSPSSQMKSFYAFVNTAADRYSDQQRTLASRLDTIVDADDRKTVNEYYTQLQRSYLLNPFNEVLSKTGARSAAEKFVKGIEDGFGGGGGVGLTASEKNKISRLNTEIGNLEAEKTKAQVAQGRGTDEEKEAATDQAASLGRIIAAKEKELEELQRKGALGGMQKCVQDKVKLPRLENAQKAFDNAIVGVGEILYKPASIQQAGASRDSSSDRMNEHTSIIEKAIKAFDEADLDGAVAACCRENGLSKDSSECKQMLGEADALTRELAKDLAVTTPDSFMRNPNPLEVERLTAQDFVTIIREKKSTLDALRRGKHSENDEYYDEQEVFESMARCRIKAKRYQTRREPMSKKMINALGKTVKCGLLPLWGASMDTQYQRLTTGIGAAPIQGGGLDFSCDPNEMQAWNAIVDQSRDPAAWGLPQMANPPYIDSLRRLPPVVTGLPGNNLSADDWLYLNPAPGLDNFDSVSRNRTGISTVNSQAGPRSDVSRNVMRTGASGYAVVSAASRGVEQGQSLSRAVRQSSSDIRKGQNAQLGATRMQSGASNTRRFIAKGLDRSRMTSSSARRAGRAETANKVSRVVMRTTGTSASRSTGQGLLGQLGQIGGQQQGLGDIGNVGANVRKVQNSVKQTIQSRINNINLARTKSEEAHKNILSLIAQYDGIVADTAIDMRDKSAKKISGIMKESQAQLYEITRQLGVKKAEYDAYQAAILSENSALSRLATFGPQNYNFIAPGQSGSGRGTASDSSSSPALDAVNAGAMPNGLPSGGRGNVTLNTWDQEGTAWAKLLHFMNPVGNAWAKTKMSDAEYDAFWMQEWRRFKHEFEGYVIGQAQQENQMAVEAAELIAARNASITEETYDYVDYDTIVTMDIYLNELEEESRFLVDGHKQGDFKLTGAVLDTVMKANVEAKASQQLLTEMQIENFKSLPKSFEDDPNLWYGLLPEVLLNH